MVHFNFIVNLIHSLTKTFNIIKYEHALNCEHDTPYEIKKIYECQ